MGDPKYTFLLPAYKSAYLEEALQSILSQSINSLKVIVSDDCSPDPIKSVVDRIDDTRLIYKRNPKNIGGENLVSHWNSLLRDCESEFVIIASDDDVYQPSFLEEIDRLGCLYPDVCLFRIAAEIINNNGTLLRRENGPETIIDTNGFLDHLLNPESVLCIGNYVFRTKALKEIGGVVDFPFAWKSDSATVLALSSNGVACSGKVLFSFRMSGQNISEHTGKEAYVDRKKLDATLKFKQWMDYNIDSVILQDSYSSIKRKLEGELRSYYWTLSFSDFIRLYHKLVRERWFKTVRNNVSFLLGWIR